MRTTIRIFATLFVALLLMQCGEEDLVLMSNGKNTDALAKAKTEYGKHLNVFKIGALVLHDYDSDINGFDYQFYLDGVGSVTVNWGDGTSSVHTIGPNYMPVSHGYGSVGRYTVTISGDLKNITHFNSYYGMGSFSAIDFRRLINLKDLDIGLTESSSKIDLSQNVNLTRVSLAGMPDLKTLVLPKKHSIRNVNLDGPFKFDTKDVDGIIENIYKNAVTRNLTGGYFTLPAEWWQDEGDLRMVGPPSASSIEKLRDLKNTYGWSIYPALDPETNL